MPSDDTEASQGQIIRVNGTDNFYKTYGQGEPLLLIHGGTITGDSWKPYIAGFAENFRLIVPDTPGHGKSGTPDAPLSYPGLADDMAALIDALDLRKPLVAGYSDGGQIALEIGMRYPALSRALVVGGAFFRFNPSYRAWLPGVFGDAAAPEIDTANFVRNHPDYGRDELARITAPTMVLVGDRDEILPVEEATELYRRLPAAELAVVPDADHGAFFAAKVHVVQPLMLDFLQRQDIQTR